jgi:hypothetical protein
MALLAVPAWWTTVNIAHAGCAETRSVENKEEEWIDCQDNFCHTCGGLMSQSLWTFVQIIPLREQIASAQTGGFRELLGALIVTGLVSAPIIRVVI